MITLFDWDVTIPGPGYDTHVNIKANRCFVIEGHLVFETSDGIMVRAFAPERWFEVKLKVLVGDPLYSEKGQVSR